MKQRGKKRLKKIISSDDDEDEHYDPSKLKLDKSSSSNSNIGKRRGRPYKGKKRGRKPKGDSTTTSAAVKATNIE